MRRNLRAKLLGSTLFVSTLLVASPAMAQDADESNSTTAATADEGDFIIVTGSRIKRSPFGESEPTITVGSQDIESLGITNIGDALSTVPAFGPASNSRVGSQGGSFGSGQTFINFFGLGSQRTLTLVDGNRYVSSNTSSIFGPVAAGSQVDLNTIPTLMVDRIETVAVGGAPIYGSDAIAGTVNIILKDEYEGLKLEGQYGMSDHGDGDEYRISALAGTNFAGGRGHVVAGFEYNRSYGLLYSDRKQSAEGLFFASPSNPDYPFDNQLITDRHINVFSQYGVPLTSDLYSGIGADVTNAAGQALRFDPNGNLIPIDFGQPTGSPVNYSGGNGFSLVPTSNLLSPTERYLGNVKASYELSDNVRMFGNFSYSSSKGTELRSQPVYNTRLFDLAGQPDGNLIIPLNNPFLSDEARATIQSSLAANGKPDQDFFYLSRANSDIISGEGSTTVEVFRFVGGFEGEFEFNDKNINWELIGNYGRSKTRGNSRELIQANFENALNGCTGSSVASPIQAINNTCAAFNPFGAQNSQAVADYLTTIAHPESLNEQWVVTADVSGELFNLWGDAAVGFVLGYEHRDESAKFDPGVFFRGELQDDGSYAGYGRSVPIDPVSGGYNTNEFFGELQVPLITPDMNIPFFNLLEAHGAARYVDNSLAGGDLTWTAGGRWKPIEALTLRGNFTRSIRAPAVTELFNPTSQIFATADDPCDSRFLQSGGNPAARQANCAAEGLAPNFTSNIVDFTVEGSLAGNTDLNNEVADSWTIGALIQPSFIPRLTLSADWVSIKLSDAITQVDADQTMAACYDSPNYPNDACSLFTRDGAGQVTFIQTGYLNAASYEYAGLIAGINYSAPTPALGANSSVTFNLNYQYIDKLETRVGDGDLATSRGDAGYSKHQATGTLAYANNGLGIYTQVQFIGPATVDPDAAANAYDRSDYETIAYVDLGLSQKFTDNITGRLVVENLFDGKAPYLTMAGGGLSTYFTGLLGRYIKLSASVEF